MPNPRYSRANGTVTRLWCWSSTSSRTPEAWYDSEAYTEARELRQAAAETNAVIISGF